MVTTSSKNKAPAKKATAAPSKAAGKPSAKKAAKKKAATGTRTTSRSAKRRSPKAPEADPEVLEYERTEFLRAMDKYKRKTGKTFPSWTEVLDVLRNIGWMHPTRVQEFLENRLAKSTAAAGKSAKKATAKKQA